ncbi:MAG: NAD-dependent epimerase/dehydratase family protein, partial [Planctomycetota bacterium]|nr:NAD-dependent epimerase/dehydratase family protein [Planctomycetota bacterium]
MSDQPLVLLTGVTGYIGGRLLPKLEEQGVPVRCMSRRPQSVENAVAETTEVVAADVLDADSIDQALSGVHTAYYFIHSMGSTADFE